MLRALRIVRLRQLDRIPRIAQLDERDALDDTPGVDVETWNHALGQHGVSNGIRPRRRDPLSVCAPPPAG
jgi:hypothetical protein